jgi:hypothetical protein
VRHTNRAVYDESTRNVFVGCSENNRSTDGSAADINAQSTKSFDMMSNAALFLVLFDNGYTAFPIGLSGG